MVVNQQALVRTLRAFEAEFTAGISEFALITRLQSAPYRVFDRDALADNLTMFQCHFVLFNALYQLRDQWFDERGLLLDIHTTSIEIRGEKAGPHAVMADDPLRTYYLDWSHFTSTSMQDVEALIDSFWERMGNPKVPANENDVRQAKALLGIPFDKTLSKSLIKKHYHKQQHLHHPDKGGNNVQAGKLSWANEVLLQQCEHLG